MDQQTTTTTAIASTAAAAEAAAATKEQHKLFCYGYMQNLDCIDKNKVRCIQSQQLWGLYTAFNETIEWENERTRESERAREKKGLLNPEQKTRAQTTFIGIKNIYRILFWQHVYAPVFSLVGRSAEFDLKLKRCVRCGIKLYRILLTIFSMHLQFTIRKSRNREK